MNRSLCIIMLLIFIESSLSYAQSTVVMNEIFSRGTATELDWIELYNPTNADIDISSYKIYDSGAKSGTKDKKAFPSGTVIKAKGFYVVVTDGSDATDFGLSNSGEEVWLENGTGTVIDDIVFPALAAGETYARIPDGSNNWKIVTNYSKGATNGWGSILIVMNEIYSRGTATEPDWIELYNLSNNEVDISSYKIYDSGAKGGTKDKKGFPTGTKIPAKGFYVVVTDGSEATDFGLSNSGEEVWLEDETGSVIDDVVFPALATGETYARIPDGGTDWKIVTDYTKGKSNVVGSAVVMNEIYSRGTATEPDWIELYNKTNSSVDLSNYKIYDSGAKSGTKDKKGFPVGTSIPAKGFFVVVTDGSEASDFGLSNSGEEVWLEDGTGTVVDDVIFSALATGETYARIPDGSSTWQIVTTYTKGKSNDTGMSVESNDEIISEYKLFQNHPNPFNPETNISYIIPKDGFVTIKIYNILGEQVAVLVNQFQTAGSHNVNLNSAQLQLTSGVYFYTLQSGNHVATKKMVVLK